MQKKWHASHTLRQHYDHSIYPEDQCLYNTENKMITLKFKNEFYSVPITEITGLKPKLYLVMTHEKQKLSAKSVTKFAQFELTREDFT